MAIPEYFETFRVVEVQQTFYEPPQKATMMRWREQAGPSFEFTMKAWQLITHRTTSSTYKRLRTPLTKEELADCGSFRPTAIVRRGWETTLACARILRATAILFQCPASFGPEPESLASMRSFFGSIERPPGVRLLWEPRGPSWPAETVHALCTELDLVHVVDPFVNRTTTPELTYWRLHGLGDHRRPYTDEELERLVTMIDPSARTAYVMFNEIPRIGDSRRFLALLSAAAGTSRDRARISAAAARPPAPLRPARPSR
jgi:uncharacterized protein YecE (DUF72 family)